MKPTNNLDEQKKRRLRKVTILFFSLFIVGAVLSSLAFSSRIPLGVSIPLQIIGIACLIVAAVFVIRELKGQGRLDFLKEQRKKKYFIIWLLVLVIFLLGTPFILSSFATEIGAIVTAIGVAVPSTVLGVMMRRQRQGKTIVEAKDVIAEQRVAEKRNLRWEPICLGAFVCVVLEVIFVQITVTADPDIRHHGTWIIVAFGFICYTIGGLIAGAIAKRRGATHGMFAALIAFVISIIINLALKRVTLGSMSTAGYAFGFIVIFCILLGFGAWGGDLGTRLRNRLIP